MKNRRLGRRCLPWKIIICLMAIVLIVAIVVVILLINKDNSSQNQAESQYSTPTDVETHESDNVEEAKGDSPEEQPTPTIPPASIPGGNCTTGLGKLMLINANYTVNSDFISVRKSQLVDISALYGITEANAWNGTPLVDEEAAQHLNDMIKAYEAAYPGHTLQTMSCFRSIGTSCGRLCAPTGTSEHHSGYTCDLIDTTYGSTLDTDYYSDHIDWQWLKANSYKYGFIDRYPVEWAGSSMAQPINLTEDGTTGYYETWHYRYVGIPEATEIATGKYNNGAYDSLEHYLKMRGFLNSLTAGTCN